MKRYFPKKAQSIAEYAMVVGMIALALTGMQIYAKRGIQAGIKLSFDQLGSQREGQIVDERTVKDDTFSHSIVSSERNTQNSLTNGQFRSYTPHYITNTATNSKSSQELRGKNEPQSPPGG